MRGTPIKPGQVFGLLTVVEFSGLRRSGKQNYRYFTCKCACGGTIVTRGSQLISSIATSCGCKMKAYTGSLKGKPQTDMTPGQKFGLLTFVKWKYTRHKAAICLFKCDCGRFCTKSSANVGRGTTSCGCVRKQHAQKMGKFYGPILKLPLGQSAFNRLYRQYKKVAVYKKIEFSIDPVEFRHKTGACCYYCGTKPVSLMKENKSTYAYNGLDRVDNKNGYTSTNTVPCCIQCNKSKRDLPQAEFITWLKRAGAHVDRLPVPPSQKTWNSASDTDTARGTEETWS